MNTRMCCRTCTAVSRMQHCAGRTGARLCLFRVWWRGAAFCRCPQALAACVSGYRRTAARPGFFIWKGAGCPVFYAAFPGGRCRPAAGPVQTNHNRWTI